MKATKALLLLGSICMFNTAVSQSFQKQLRIHYDSTTACTVGSGVINENSKKLNLSILDALDSLSLKYAFQMVGHSVPAYLKIMSCINSPQSNSALTELFAFNSTITIKDNNADTLISKIDIYYKDFEKMPYPELLKDTYSALNKIFSRIIIPMEIPLMGSKNPNVTECITFTRPTSDSQLGNYVEDILNNILVVHQRNFNYNYLKLTKPAISTSEGGCRNFSFEIVSDNLKSTIKFQLGKNFQEPSLGINVTFENLNDKLTSPYPLVWKLNRYVYYLLQTNYSETNFD